MMNTQVRLSVYKLRCVVDPKRLESVNADHSAVIETGTNYVIVSIPKIQKDCLVKGQFSYQSATNEKMSHVITMRM